MSRSRFGSLTLLVLGFTPLLAADDKKPAAQKYCPVMVTDEIDHEASKTVEWKGVKIYVCCDECITRFKRDPAAYLDAKLVPALAGMELPKRDIEQVFCPVYKERKVSSKDPFVMYKGVKVYVYNNLAKQRFEKDPDRYADVKVLPQLKNAKQEK
jgi:YHS domain-containing protein